MKKVKYWQNLIVEGEYFDGTERLLQFQGLANSGLFRFFEIDEEGEPKKEDATLLVKSEVEELFISYEPDSIIYTNFSYFYELEDLTRGDLLYWGDDSFCKVEATEAEKRWLTYACQDFFLWEDDREQTAYLKEYMENNLEDEVLIGLEKWDDVKGWVDYDFPHKATVAEYADWCVGGYSDFFPSVNSKKDVVRLNYAYIVDGADIFGGEED